MIVLVVNRELEAHSLDTHYSVVKVEFRIPLQS
jgi:hypothetical protein